LQPGSRVFADGRVGGTGTERQTGGSGEGAGGEVIVAATDRADALGGIFARGGVSGSPGAIVGGAGGYVEVTSPGQVVVDSFLNAVGATSAEGVTSGEALVAGGDRVRLMPNGTFSLGTVPAGESQISYATVAFNNAPLTVEAGRRLEMPGNFGKGDDLTLRTRSTTTAQLPLDPLNPGADRRSGVFIGGDVNINGRLAVETAGLFEVRGGFQSNAPFTTYRTGLDVTAGGIVIAGPTGAGSNAITSPTFARLRATGATTDPNVLNGAVAVFAPFTSTGPVTVGSDNNFVYVGPANRVADFAPRAALRFDGVGNDLLVAAGNAVAGLPFANLARVWGGGTVRVATPRELVNGAGSIGWNAAAAVRVEAATVFNAGEIGGNVADPAAEAAGASLLVRAPGGIENAAGALIEAGQVASQTDSGWLWLDTTGQLPFGTLTVPAGGAGIVNRGTIRAYRVATVTSAAGVENVAGASIAAGNSVAGTHGVRITAPGTITNAGTINGFSSTQPNPSGNGTGPAVLLVSGTEVVNTGAITGFGVGTGLVLGGGVRVDARGIAEPGGAPLFRDAGGTALPGGAVRNQGGFIGGHGWTEVNAATDVVNSAGGQIGFSNFLTVIPAGLPRLSVTAGGQIVNGLPGETVRSLMRALSPNPFDPDWEGVKLTAGGGVVNRGEISTGNVGILRIVTTGAGAGLVNDSGNASLPARITADRRLDLDIAGSLFSRGEIGAGGVNGTLRMRSNGDLDIGFADPAAAITSTGIELVAGGAIRVGARLRSLAALTLDAGTDIVLRSATLEADFSTTSTVTLRAGGSVTQEAGHGGIRTFGLTASAGTGSILLDGGGSRSDTRNAFARLDGATAGGDITLRPGTVPLTIAGAIAAPDGTVTLNVFGATQQSAGTIAARELRIDSGNTVTLNATGNAVARLGAGDPGANFTFVTEGDLQVTGPLGNATFFNQSGAAIRLTSVTGSITQAATGAGITANNLVLSAAGDVLLDGIGNAIQSPQGSAGGIFRVTGAQSAAMVITSPIAAPVVELRNAGDITQAGAGAVITADTLRVAAGGAVRLNGTTNAVGTLGASSARGELLLTNGRALTLDEAIDVSANGALRRIVVTNTGSIGAGPALTGATGVLELNADGAGAQVSVNGALAAATLQGRATTLFRAITGGSALTLGAITAPEIDAGTTGTLTLNANLSAATGIALTGGTGISQTGGVLTTPRLRVATTTGDAVLAQNNATPALAQSSVAGLLSLRTTGALAITGPVGAGTLRLVANGGGITQSASGAGITTARLELTAPADVTLASTENAISGLGAVTLTGGRTLTLRTGGALHLQAAVSVATLDLTAGGNITQALSTGGSAPPAPITATQLRVATPGNVELSGFGPGTPRLTTPLYGNSLSQLGASTVGGRLYVEANNAAPFAITGPVSAGTLEITTRGSITQTAPVTADRLFVASRGDVTLTDPGNSFARLGNGELGGANVQGTLRLSTQGDLEIAGLSSAGTAFLSAGGNITQASSLAGLWVSGTLHATAAGGTVRLTGFEYTDSTGFFTGNEIRRLGTISAADEVSIRTMLALSVEAPLSSRLVHLATTGTGRTVTQASGATVAAETLRLDTSGAVTLTLPGNAVRGLGASRIGGLFQLSGSGPLDIAGNVQAPEIRLDIAGAITQSVAGLITPLLRASGTTVALDFGNTVDALGASGASGGRFGLFSTRALRVTGAVTGAEVVLDATSLSVEAPVSGAMTLRGRSGDVTQTTAGALTGSLAVSAGRAIGLDQAANPIPTLGDVSAGTAARIATNGALALTGSVTAPLLVLNTGGAITQPGGALDVGRLEVTTSGAVTLDRAGNAIDVLAALTAPGITIVSAGDMEIAGALNSASPLARTDISLRTGGNLVTGTSSMLARNVTLAADGDVTLRGDIQTTLGTTLAVTAGRAIALESGTIDLGQLVAGGPDRTGTRIELRAGAGIAQATTHGGLRAETLLATSTAGDVLLSGGGNRLRNLAGGSAGGTFRLVVPINLPEGSNPLQITAPLSAALVQLDSHAGVRQNANGAGVTANEVRFSVGSALAEARLDGNGNRIGRLGSSSYYESNEFRIVTSGTLEVVGPFPSTFPGGQSPPSLTLRLTSTDGGITQPAGSPGIAAGLVLNAGGGNVRVAEPGNRIPGLSGSATGSFIVVDSLGVPGVSGMGTNGISAPEIELRSAGILGASSLVTPVLRVVAGGLVNIDGTNAIGTVRELRAVGSATIRNNSGPLLLDGPIVVTQAGDARTLQINVVGDILGGPALALQTGRLALGSSGGRVELTSGITAAQLDVFAATSADVAATASLLTVQGATAPTLRIGSTGALFLDGDLRGTSSVTLAAGTGITQATGTAGTPRAIETPLLRVGTTAGDAILDNPRNFVRALGRSDVAGRLMLASRADSAALAADPLLVSEPVRAGVLEIALGSARFGTDAIRQAATGAAIEAGTLRVAVDANTGLPATTQNARFTGAGNRIGTLGAGSLLGTLAVATAGDMAIAGPINVGTLDVMAAGNITRGVGGGVTASRLVARSTGGDVTLAGLDVPAVEGAAAGLLDIALTAPGGATTGPLSGSRVRVGTTGVLTLGASISGTTSVELLGGGGVGQLAAGNIATPRFIARATTGDVVLTQGIAAGSVEGAAAGLFDVALAAGGGVGAMEAGRVRIGSPGALTIDAAITATTSIELSAASGIGRSAAGRITTPRLTVRSTAGDVVLNDGIAAAYVEGTAGGLFDIALAAPGGASTGLLNAGRVRVSSSGGLTVAAPITATTAIELAAANLLGQTAGGVLTTPRLAATSTAGDVRLDAAANAVQAVRGSAAGRFALRTGTALTVDGALA
uniref:beta strand repeat-containing protein n=1 Tax=Falsiroseomonas oryzae TaxID=2766473 RepID=UPI0022EA1137